MKVKMLAGGVRVNGCMRDEGEVYEFSDEDAQSLIDTGWAVEVKADGKSFGFAKPIKMVEE